MKRALLRAALPAVALALLPVVIVVVAIIILNNHKLAGMEIIFRSGIGPQWLPRRKESV
ncbi:MAG: hypothetical protein AAB855_00045 [Patescibacteria group bacterium]